MRALSTMCNLLSVSRTSCVALCQVSIIDGRRRVVHALRVTLKRPKPLAFGNSVKL